jgi:hypothetical protein
MTDRSINLDRVTIDGELLHRRSATLRFGSGGGKATTGWSVHVLGRTAPLTLAAGEAPRFLEATTAAGRQLHAQVRIVDRGDDEWGTRLVLVGIGPVHGL